MKRLLNESYIFELIYLILGVLLILPIHRFKLAIMFPNICTISSQMVFHGISIVTIMMKISVFVLDINKYLSRLDNQKAPVLFKFSYFQIVECWHDRSVLFSSNRFLLPSVVGNRNPSHSTLKFVILGALLNY